MDLLCIGLRPIFLENYLGSCGGMLDFDDLIGTFILWFSQIMKKGSLKPAIEDTASTGAQAKAFSEQGKKNRG